MILWFSKKKRRRNQMNVRAGCMVETYKRMMALIALCPGTICPSSSPLSHPISRSLPISLSHSLRLSVVYEVTSNKFTFSSTSSHHFMLSHPLLLSRSLSLPLSIYLSILDLCSSLFLVDIFSVCYCFDFSVYSDNMNEYHIWQIHILHNHKNMLCYKDYLHFTSLSWNINFSFYDKLGCF